MRQHRLGLAIGLVFVATTASAELDVQNPEFMRNGAAVCVGVYTAAPVLFSDSGGALTFWHGIVQRYREDLTDAEIETLLDEHIEVYEQALKDASSNEASPMMKKMHTDFIRNSAVNCEMTRALIERQL